MPNLHELNHRFNSHAPQNEDDFATMAEIRRKCLSLALFINEVVPAGRQQALAFTYLEEVMMWANKGIAEKL